MLAYDMHKKQHFTLRAMLLWGIHDFPDFGNLAGCITHGYKACPICSDNTQSIYLENAKKIVYTNYRLFLPLSHPFRSGKYLGLKREELNIAPLRLSGERVMQQVSHIKL